jgi:hypothetical protein
MERGNSKDDDEGKLTCGGTCRHYPEVLKKMKESITPFQYLNFRLASFLIAVLVFWFWISRIYWGALSYSWPSTTGTIVSSNVKNGELSSSKIFIEYEYKVDGRRYLANRLSAGPWPHFECFRKDADVILSKYPVGKNAEVYYDPSHPQKATLNLSFGRYSIESYFDFLMIAIIMGTLGFAFFAHLPESSPVWSRIGLGLISKSLESHSQQSKKG